MVARYVIHGRDARRRGDKAYRDLRARLARINQVPGDKDGVRRGAANRVEQARVVWAKFSIVQVRDVDDAHAVERLRQALRCHLYIRALDRPVGPARPRKRGRCGGDARHACERNCGSAGRRGFSRTTPGHPQSPSPSRRHARMRANSPKICSETSICALLNDSLAVRSNSTS